MINALLLSLQIYICSADSSFDFRTPNIKITAQFVAQQSQVLVSANANRRCLYIWNNGANSMYLTFGPTSNSSTPTTLVPTFSSFIMTGLPIYTGIISAIRNAGSGGTTAYECMP